MAASLFVLAFDTDSELTDAYCAIVVELFIVGPALYVAFELISRVRKLRSTGGGWGHSANSFVVIILLSLRLLLRMSRL